MGDAASKDVEITLQSPPVALHREPAGFFVIGAALAQSVCCPNGNAIAAYIWNSL